MASLSDKIKFFKFILVWDFDQYALHRHFEDTKTISFLKIKTVEKKKL